MASDGGGPTSASGALSMSIGFVGTNVVGIEFEFEFESLSIGELATAFG